jgi:hypothetical protein
VFSVPTMDRSLLEARDVDEFPEDAVRDGLEIVEGEFRDGMLTEIGRMNFIEARVQTRDVAR